MKNNTADRDIECLYCTRKQKCTFAKSISFLENELGYGVECWLRQGPDETFTGFHELKIFSAAERGVLVRLPYWRHQYNPQRDLVIEQNAVN